MASNFSVRGGWVVSGKTGGRLPLDLFLLRDAAVWGVFHLLVRTRSLALHVLGRAGPSIAFTPDQPRPWYLVHAAALWAGAPIARGAAAADVQFDFEDATWSAARRPKTGVNGGCVDISKSYVAAVFEEVFGYPLAVDPQRWRGPAVEKAEVNGLHDGRLVECPRAPTPGKAYQRLIETGRGDEAWDLRTPCVAGRPVVVWVKCKPARARFAIQNRSVRAEKPEVVFTPAERALIARFNAAMALEWGGLDILRERDTGRLFIVDVNKTDVGPVLGLPLADKLRGTAALAGALRAMLEARVAGVRGPAAELAPARGRG